MVHIAGVSHIIHAISNVWEKNNAMVADRNGLEKSTTALQIKKIYMKYLKSDAMIHVVIRNR